MLSNNRTETQLNLNYEGRCLARRIVPSFCGGACFLILGSFTPFMMCQLNGTDHQAMPRRVDDSSDLGGGLHGPKEEAES